MSRTYLTISVALLSAFAMTSHAQTSTQATYTQANGAKADMSNVVRARFVKPGDVSPEEYQRLLVEAEKIRAYQAAQSAQYQASQYGTTYVQPGYAQPVRPQVQNYTGQPGIAHSGVQGSSGQIQGPFYQAQTQTVQPQASQQVQTYNYGQTYQTYPAQNYINQNSNAQTAQRQTYVPVQPQPVAPKVIQPQSIPATFATPQIAHSVVKGDTLYNISKRYGVPLSTIRQSNGLATNTISIGQRIIIPSVQKTISTPASTARVPVQTYSQPQYVVGPQNQQQIQAQPQPQYVPQSYQGQPYQGQAYQGQPYTAPSQTYVQPSTYKPVSYHGTYPGTLQYQSATQVPTNATGTKPRLIRSVQPVPPTGVYAVLPKDTLYSISKIACVRADDIAKANGITDAGSLQPGQKLSMPAGHCLR